jgi:hypothetical protein
MSFMSVGMADEHDVNVIGRNVSHAKTREKRAARQLDLLDSQGCWKIRLANPLVIAGRSSFLLDQCERLSHKRLWV